MPKNTKAKSKSTRKATTSSNKVKQTNSIWDIFKFGESYTSLILGIVVVVIATVLLLTFVKGKNITPKAEDKQPVAVQTVQNTPTQAKSEPKPTSVQNLPKNEQKKSTPVQTQINQTISGTSYTVVSGDNLWNIAERKYKSGYNWVDIQKANKITNPNVLFAGTKLTLPNVQAKVIVSEKPTATNQQVGSSVQTNKISGNSYTVVKGDTLWDISVRAYGDGYAWTKISQANKLPNPNVIHSGNKITIPRG